MTDANPTSQRAALLDGAVAHVLDQGIGTLSLRPLAAALGTSDRMLLYYFGTREALLEAVLVAAGSHLQAALDASLPAEPVSTATLFAVARRLADDPAAQPYLRLYVELSGLAAARREPFAAATARIAQGWLEWTTARIDPGAGDPATTAAGVLAAVDGLLLVRFALGADHADRAAAWLTETLGGSRSR
ncbi:MAG: TetR/AcrR family transcriptional regulator [Dermatophilaceae bacterium]